MNMIYFSHQVESNQIKEQPTARPTVSVDKGINLVSLWNSFDTLMEKDKVLDVDDTPYVKLTNYNDLLEDDDEEVEEVFHEPWCMFGDFNVSLHVDEKSIRSFYIDTGMRNFQDFVDAFEVSDVNNTCLRFT
ncbi:RNA-directed DNA polymerase, eukaryota, reverse transcriptase zinc-binding domain protein [Tanacetum coccineum]